MTTADRGPQGSPLRFFVLVFALSAPFLVLGGLSDAQLVPGVPLAGLALVCPVGAALICAYRERRSAGVRALLARAVDFRRIARAVWYLPVLLLYPTVLVVSYVLLRLRGVDVPPPEVGPGAVVLAAGFFVGAVCEELGWSGYAAEVLLRRRSALTTGLVVGAVWAVWHWVALLQVGRSLPWIAWWTLCTVATRVVMVWLFANTGRSVAAMALFHAVLNLGWQLFPVRGSYYDQPTVAVLVSMVAIVVTCAWGPRTLAGRWSGDGAGAR